LTDSKSIDENLDKECIDVVDSDINMSVPWYLMSAYAYHVEDNPVISNARFDRLSKVMLENWDSIEHKCKHCITKEDLEAKKFTGEYPNKVKRGLESLRGIYHGKKRS
jgi:hypothetical protein